MAERTPLPLDSRERSCQPHGKSRLCALDEGNRPYQVQYRLSEPTRRRTDFHDTATNQAIRDLGRIPALRCIAAGEVEETKQYRLEDQTVVDSGVKVAGARVLIFPD